MLFRSVKDGRTSELCLVCSIFWDVISYWTFQIAASSYFPKTCYKLPHIKSIQSLAANKTEMDLDVSKWNLDRHTKSICVNTFDILKVTNTPVDWWICFETSPVCTFSPEFVGHRHRQKTNICCLAPGVGSRCDIIVVRSLLTGLARGVLRWFSTSQNKSWLFWFGFLQCISLYHATWTWIIFLFDLLDQWRQVAACGWSEKTCPGWMKLLDNFEGVSFGGQFFLQAVGVPKWFLGPCHICVCLRWHASASWLHGSASGRMTSLPKRGATDFKDIWWYGRWWLMIWMKQIAVKNLWYIIYIT